MYIYIYITHWFSCIYVYMVFVCKMAVFQHQSSNEYESIKISVKTHIWKTDINIHRENINGKTRIRPKKNTFVYVCLFLVGTKCQDILTYFDNISGGLFRSLRTSIRIRSSKSEASEADNSELSMPSWKGGECFDLVGGWGGVQNEFRTQQKLTENRKTYYSIKPTKNIPGIAICFSKYVLILF